MGLNLVDMNVNSSKKAILQEIFDDLLTLDDVCLLFGKNHVTIHFWKKNKGMPFIYLENTGRGCRPIIRFELEALKPWAKENKIFMNNLSVLKAK